AVAGSAIFNNLSIDKAAIGYFLSASSAGMLSTSSSSFDISAGAAAKLAYITQPSDAIAGSFTANPVQNINSIAPAVQVALQDAFGNTLTTDNASTIIMSISNNPGVSTLTSSVSLTGTVAAGIATFTDLE